MMISAFEGECMGNTQMEEQYKQFRDRLSTAKTNDNFERERLAINEDH